MSGVFIGDTKSMVFPILCDAHLKQDYSKYNLGTTLLADRQGVWGLTEFSIEAVFTPYDVNGYGSKTSSSQGVLNSKKTMPSLGVGASNSANYQSYDYLGTNRGTHKMMLYHNANFSFYLQNTAPSNINRPAEYKLVASFPNISTTVESETLIFGTNKMFNYVDSNSFYEGDSTSLRKISSTATNVTPFQNITIASNSLPTNVTAAAATGTITMTGEPEQYYPAQSATATLTASSNNFTVDTLPTTGTGTIKFGANPSVASASTTTTEYIQITNQDNTVTKWICGDGSSPTFDVDSNGFLNTLNWPANSRTYRSSSSAELTLAQLVSAINAYNAGWDGTVTGGPDPLDATANPPAIIATLTTAINGSSPNRTGAGGSISIGSGMSSDIIRTQISGGTAENVVTNNFITIVENGRTRKYHPYPDNADNFPGQQVTRGSTTFICFEKKADANATLQQLAAAINHTNGNTGITASVSLNVLTLTDDSAGTGGNSYSVSRTHSTMTSVLSMSNFSGGEAANETGKYIQVEDSDGTVTKFHPVHSTKSGISNASSFSYGGNSYVAYVYTAGSYISNFITAFNSVTALDISAGSQSSGNIPLTQGTTGTSGNTTITNQNSLSNVSVSGFSGGVNASTPDNKITLTDASGVVKQYKASVNESTGTTDGTYVFFQKGSDTTATANNLITAINGTNGHNGSITASNPSSNNVVKVVVGQGSNYALTENIDQVTILAAWNTATTDEITFASSSELVNIGVGESLYNSNGLLIGTVESISNAVVTISEDAPVNSATTTIYASQPREALYLESVVKVSCTLNKSGNVNLYINNSLAKSQLVTFTNGFSFDASNCYIGNDGTNKNTQFMGELFEIGMYKRPTLTNFYKTLNPGYSDIVFYYRFGDE